LFNDLLQALAVFGFRVFSETGCFLAEEIHDFVVDVTPRIIGGIDGGNHHKSQHDIDQIPSKKKTFTVCELEHHHFSWVNQRTFDWAMAILFSQRWGHPPDVVRAWPGMKPGHGRSRVGRRCRRQKDFAPLGFDWSDRIRYFSEE
jgi:hypothetical protein